MCLDFFVAVRFVRTYVSLCLAQFKVWRVVEYEAKEGRIGFAVALAQTQAYAVATISCCIRVVPPETSGYSVREKGGHNPG